MIRKAVVRNPSKVRDVDLPAGSVTTDIEAVIR